MICRWRKGDPLINVMPTAERILGFSNRWYTPAIATAPWVEIDDVVRALADRFSGSA